MMTQQRSSDSVGSTTLHFMAGCKDILKSPVLQLIVCSTYLTGPQTQPLPNWQSLLQLQPISQPQVWLQPEPPWLTEAHSQHSSQPQPTSSLSRPQLQMLPQPRQMLEQPEALPTAQPHHKSLPQSTSTQPQPVSQPQSQTMSLPQPQTVSLSQLTSLPQPETVSLPQPERVSLPEPTLLSEPEPVRQAAAGQQGPRSLDSSTSAPQEQSRQEQTVQLHLVQREVQKQQHHNRRKDIGLAATASETLQAVQLISTSGDGMADGKAGDGTVGETVAEDSVVVEVTGHNWAAGGDTKLEDPVQLQMEQEAADDPGNMSETKVETRRPPSPGAGLRRSSRDLRLSHYTRSDSAPQLQYTPIEQTVSPGSPVSLKCSAIGSPTPVITWTRDEQPLLTSHRTSLGSFRTALGQVVSHVNLSDVTVREGGVYTCSARSSAGSVAHSARINVYGPPFVRAMPNVTTVAGEEVRLWCPAGGFPTPSITWRRHGHTLPTSSRQEVLANGTLVLRAAASEDAGRYSCLVSGSQGQTAASHTFLHVLKPPEIETFTFRRNLEEGRRTQLSCTVTGGDLPITINWLKDGRHLQHDPDVQSKPVSEFSMALIFKRLREHHSGSYTCEAANAAAAVNHTATLRVKVSPRWLVEPRSGTALVASSVVLDCGARGYPTPVLTWMKATGEGAAQELQQVVADGLRWSQAANGSLILHDAKTGDAGWYRCTADNSVGNPISKDVQLIVHAPARVVTAGRRVTGHAGHTVTVPCEATGDPLLTLAWRRHHAPLSPGHRTSIRESQVGSVLRSLLEIREVTAADAGAYTCLATNPHGDHSQVFHLAIIEPPSAPSGVSVGDITSRSAVVSWTLPQPASITIQYKGSAEESWASQGRNVSVGQWRSSHALTELQPHRTYVVRLLAHNDLGVSQPSHAQVFTTAEEAPSGAPREVGVRAGGPYSLLVTWRAPDPRLTHGALRGYTLALRRQNLQGDLTYITRPVTDVEGVEQYEARGLRPATLYEVAVRAFTRAGPGPLSSPRIVDSTSHDAPSCAPAGVSCRGSGRGRLRVWWSPPPIRCSRAPVAGYSIVASLTAHAHHIAQSGPWQMHTTNLERSLDGLPPAANISVTVTAFNDVGSGSPNRPVFCVTEDDVPGPPERVRVTATSATTLLVTWAPPQPRTGAVLHYTLYSARDEQVAVRDVVGAGDSEATWRELTGLTPASRMQVWVTATTTAGEGNPSSRITALTSSKPIHSPLAVGGGRMWTVGAGAGVTLGCRGLGSPPPTITWTRAGAALSSGHLTQLLPGGDLHLTAVRETANYTCWARSKGGVDTLTHRVVPVSPPTPPTLALAYATHHTLNLTIVPTGDGGAPILGYTVHHRGRAGEWAEMGVEAGSEGAVVRGLPCGAAHHLYLTAWNTRGTSSPSPVLIVNTLGSPPGRPEPTSLVEVNSSCIALRLYVWPELGCPVTHWKVERGGEGPRAAWTVIHSHLTRDTTDLGLCDLTSATWHLLRVTASSTAGDTTLVYRVASHHAKTGSVTGESVEEVLVGVGAGPEDWLDAHTLAGVVSAFLLAAAVVICACVAFRRRSSAGYRSCGRSEGGDRKGGAEEDNARNSELTRAHLYSPTPTKKPRGSLASLKTQDDTSDPYEICPYATFSVGSSEGTLEYGLSLHAMTPRECLDHPAAHAHTHQSPAYGQVGRHRAQSHYKETEMAYVGRGDYGSRPKSISGGQPPKPAPPSSDQRPWAEEAGKDTRGRPHRPRSRTRAETPGGGRDSSTESNDASSPMQQRQHQHQAQHHYKQQQQAATTGVGPQPLPPVRQVRARTQSSSGESSSPRPLHPPSAFSDSRELSEAECDREVFPASPRAPGVGQEDIKAELTVLLQRYQQQRKDEEGEVHKKQGVTDKNPYTINV